MFLCCNLLITYYAVCFGEWGKMWKIERKEEIRRATGGNVDLDKPHGYWQWEMRMERTRWGGDEEFEWEGDRERAVSGRAVLVTVVGGPPTASSHDPATMPTLGYLLRWVALSLCNSAQPHTLPQFIGNFC